LTGREIPVKALPRRVGDPPRLVAANGRAREALGWEPERTLEDMIRDVDVVADARPVRGRVVVAE